MNEQRIDTSIMQRIGGQLGSNAAGIYQDAGGQRYYVKTLESAVYVRNEFISAQLYRLAGAPTLTYSLTKKEDELATLWQPLDKKCIAHFTEAQRLQAQQWFAVHAWTANWDLAGFHGDNQGVCNGKVVTLDLGGALNFRAMGDPKGKAFSTQVNELETLRQDPNNPHALKLFADMNPQKILAAIQVVTQLSDELIAQTIIENGGHQKLVDKMLARKADMLKRYRYCSTSSHSNISSCDKD